LKVSIDVVGARDDAIARVDENAKSTAKREAQSSKRVASRLRFKFSPMEVPLSRVLNSGLATPPSHCSVSIAAGMTKRESTGPSHKTCRMPMVLYTSESPTPILTLAPKWSLIIVLTKWSGRPNCRCTARSASLGNVSKAIDLDGEFWDAKGTSSSSIGYLGGEEVVGIGFGFGGFLILL
jgi:hypothetical protein